MSNINLKQTKDVFKRISDNPKSLDSVKNALNDFFGDVGGSGLNNAERRYILNSLIERAHLIGPVEDAKAGPIVAVQ